MTRRTEDIELGRLAYLVFNRCYGADQRMPPFADLSVHEQRSWVIVGASIRRRLQVPPAGPTLPVEPCQWCMGSGLGF